MPPCAPGDITRRLERAIDVRDSSHLPNLRQVGQQRGWASFSWVAPARAVARFMTLRGRKPALLRQSLAVYPSDPHSRALRGKRLGMEWIAGQ